jgi:hypothetical protein
MWAVLTDIEGLADGSLNALRIHYYADHPDRPYIG